MIYAPPETDFDVMQDGQADSPQRPDLGDAQQQSREGYGISCPHCGAPHIGNNKEVRWTNPKGHRACIFRRRRCRCCTKEFTTKETVFFSQ